MVKRAYFRASWQPIETAPSGVEVLLRVTDEAGQAYNLPFVCKLTDSGWVNAVRGSLLTVRPTHWQEYTDQMPPKNRS